MEPERAVFTALLFSGDSDSRAWNQLFELWLQLKFVSDGVSVKLLAIHAPKQEVVYELSLQSGISASMKSDFVQWHTSQSDETRAYGARFLSPSDADTFHNCFQQLLEAVSQRQSKSARRSSDISRPAVLPHPSVRLPSSLQLIVLLPDGRRVTESASHATKLRDLLRKVCGREGLPYKHHYLKPEKLRLDPEPAPMDMNLTLGEVKVSKLQLMDRRAEREMLGGKLSFSNPWGGVRERSEGRQGNAQIQLLQGRFNKLDSDTFSQPLWMREGIEFHSPARSSVSGLEQVVSPVDSLDESELAAPFRAFLQEDRPKRSSSLRSRGENEQYFLDRALLDPAPLKSSPRRSPRVPRGTFSESDIRDAVTELSDSKPRPSTPTRRRAPKPPSPTRPAQESGGSLRNKKSQVSLFKVSEDMTNKLQDEFSQRLSERQSRSPARLRADAWKSGSENLSGGPAPWKSGSENLSGGPTPWKFGSENLSGGPTPWKSGSENLSGGPAPWKSGSENLSGGPTPWKSGSENLSGGPAPGESGDSGLGTEAGNSCGDSHPGQENTVLEEVFPLASSTPDNRTAASRVKPDIAPKPSRLLQAVRKPVICSFPLYPSTPASAELLLSQNHTVRGVAGRVEKWRTHLNRQSKEEHDCPTEQLVFHPHALGVSESDPLIFHLPPPPPDSPPLTPPPMALTLIPPPVDDISQSDTDSSTQSNLDLTESTPQEYEEREHDNGVPATYQDDDECMLTSIDEFNGVTAAPPFHGDDPITEIGGEDVTNLEELIVLPPPNLYMETPEFPPPTPLRMSLDIDEFPDSPSDLPPPPPTPPLAPPPGSLDAEQEERTSRRLTELLTAAAESLTGDGESGQASSLVRAALQLIHQPTPQVSGSTHPPELSQLGCNFKACMMDIRSEKATGLRPCPDPSSPEGEPDSCQEGSGKSDVAHALARAMKERRFLLEQTSNSRAGESLEHLQHTLSDVWN